MPNIKSAKKRVKVNATKNQDADMAQTVRVAVKKLDQAAAKGILHKNNAARKKSQLAARMNKAV